MLRRGMRQAGSQPNTHGNILLQIPLH